MSMSTATKVCIIFGYGPGLSAAVARKWSSQGYAVALLARTADKVARAAAELGSTGGTGGQAKGYACDVTDAAAMAQTITQIEQDLGPNIECIVYNAGNGVWKPWNEIPVADFEKGFQTNVSGLLSACQVIVPGMIQRGKGGQVLITGATASLRGKPNTCGFAPHKGAQRLLAQSLARDLGPKGIHVGYFIIDGMIGPNSPTKIDPDAIAETYWHVATQPKTCWSFETEVRPNVETW